MSQVRNRMHLGHRFPHAVRCYPEYGIAIADADGGGPSDGRGGHGSVDDDRTDESSDESDGSV